MLSMVKRKKKKDIFETKICSCTVNVPLYRETKRIVRNVVDVVATSRVPVTC